MDAEIVQIGAADVVHGDVLELLSRVRKVGIQAIAAEAELRHEAADMLAAANPFEVPALTRIVSAGTRPSYWQYTMSDLLVARIMRDPDQFVKRSARVVDALLSDLLVRSKREEFRCQDAEGLCDAIARSRSIAQQISFGYDLAPILGDDELETLLVPESGVGGEIVFLRVLQCGDVIFDMGNRLADAAVHHVKLGRWDLVAAYEELGWLLGLLSLQSLLLNVLSAGLTKEDWHKMRSLVEEPSVIQSRAYSSLVERLGEAGRLLPYPRIVGEGAWAREFEVFAADVSGVVLRCQTMLEEWFKKHLGVAKAFNRVAAEEGDRKYLSEGTPALASQRPKFQAPGAPEAS
jgi:hypothetical protein